MEILKKYLNKQSLAHHAYCLLGNRELIVPDLEEFIEKELNLSLKGNVDAHHYSANFFGIDDSRELLRQVSQMGMTNSTKLFIISPISMTIEAQNSLLKVFEEPTKDTLLFFIVRSADQLLETLSSRMLIIDDVQYRANSSFDASVFLSANLDVRFKMLKKTIEEKDKTASVNFLTGVLYTLYKSGGVATQDINKLRVMRDIEKSLVYIEGRSPSIKMLLEHLCLVIPQTNTE